MTYLDNGATSFHKPPQVLQAVCRAMRTCANPGRGGYAAAMAKYTLLTMVGSALCCICCVTIAPGYSLLSFLLRLGIVCIVFPAVWIGATFRTAEFRAMWKLGLRLLGRFLPSKH